MFSGSKKLCFQFLGDIILICQAKDLGFICRSVDIDVKRLKCLTCFDNAAMTQQFKSVGGIFLSLMYLGKVYKLTKVDIKSLVNVFRPH